MDADAQDQIDRLVADGRATPEDADAVETFAAFLHDLNGADTSTCHCGDPEADHLGVLHDDAMQTKWGPYARGEADGPAPTAPVEPTSGSDRP